MAKKQAVEQTKKCPLHIAFEEANKHTFNDEEIALVKSSISSMLQFVSKYKAAMADLNNQLSVIDKALSKLYHAVEQQDKFDLMDGFIFTKQVQKLCRERRRIKSTLRARETILTRIEPVLSDFTRSLEYAKKIMEDCEQYLGLDDEEV